MQNNSSKEIYQAIGQASSILLNMDTRTDFDALSSVIVFSRILPQINKLAKVKIIHAKAIKATFEGFFDYSQIVTETDISTVALSEVDLVVYLDSGDSKHTTTNPDFTVPEHIKTINIDHHISNNSFGTLNYVKNLGSCCSVLYTLFKEWNIKLGLEELKILVPGMLTDTGFLQYNTTTSTDFRIIADMIDKGVNMSELFFAFAVAQRIDEVRFKELIYNNLHVDFDKGYAYSAYTLAELKARKINMDNVAVRHSDVIKNIKGLDFVFVVDEEFLQPGSYSVSFRAADNKTPVVDFAKALGGGGHLLAAGAPLGECKDINAALGKVLTVLNR